MENSDRKTDQILNCLKGEIFAEPNNSNDGGGNGNGNGISSSYTMPENSGVVP